MPSTLPTIYGDDLIVMSRTIWGEAHGESPEGQRAVAHVILNRWRSKKQWYGSSIAAICLKPHQFSAWNEDNPNRIHMLTRHFGNCPALRRIGIICFTALDDTAYNLDPTNGATHYHPAAATPKWAQGKVSHLIVGPHLFYNNID